MGSKKVREGIDKTYFFLYLTPRVSGFSLSLLARHVYVPPSEHKLGE